MIDVEPIIFDTVCKGVKARFPKAKVEGVYVESAAEFPLVCIYEDDNVTFSKTQDGSLREHHAQVVYTVMVYSNKKNGKKEEAKAIAKTVDEIMQDMKFTRVLLNQIPNVDRSIYRIVARYKAIVSEGVKNADGKTTYQIFRR